MEAVLYSGGSYCMARAEAWSSGRLVSAWQRLMASGGSLTLHYSKSDKHIDRQILCNSPNMQVRVNSQRNSRSKTIAIYFQSSITFNKEMLEE